MALIGVDLAHYGPFTTLYTSVTGRSRVDMVRLFCQTQTPPTGPWANVTTYINAGMQVLVSFKATGTWANVAAGGEDARIDAIGNFFASQSNTPARQQYYTFNHEPENDGQPAADYRAALARVISRISAITPESRWIGGPCYMGSTMHGTTYGSAGHPNYQAGRDPQDWWPTGGANILFVDPYNYMGATAGPWASTPAGSAGSQTYVNTHPRDVDDFQEWIDFGIANGCSRFGIGEFGSAVHNPGAGAFNVPPGTPDLAERRQWYFDFSSRWRNDPRLEFVCFYEQGNNEGFTEIRMSAGESAVLAADPTAMANFALLLPAGVVDDAFDRTVPLIPYLITAPASSLELGTIVPVADVNDTFERTVLVLPYLITAPGSSVDMAAITTGHVAVWDDSLVKWDDPNYTWDGNQLAPEELPVFQGSAFQADAFPVSAFIPAEIAQTLPSLTQAAIAVTVTHAATINAVLPALQQAATVLVREDALLAQTLPALAQTLEAALQVTARITGASLGGAFQQDAVQTNAFASAADEGQLLPSLTQHAAGGVLAAGGIFADAASVLPSLAQAVAGLLESSNEIAQTLPALVQAMAAEIPQTSGIASVLPALTQQATGTSSFAIQGSIIQTLPSLDSSAGAQVTRALWDEWLVTTGDEWLVKTS